MTQHGIISLTELDWSQALENRQTISHFRELLSDLSNIILNMQTIRYDIECSRFSNEELKIQSNMNDSVDHLAVVVGARTMSSQPVNGPRPISVYILALSDAVIVGVEAPARTRYAFDDHSFGNRFPVFVFATHLPLNNLKIVTIEEIVQERGHYSSIEVLIGVWGTLNKCKIRRDARS